MPWASATEDGEEGAGEQLPVPEAEAETLKTRVDEMIAGFDDLMVGRSDGYWSFLGEWDAPNRVQWEEDFHSSQLDMRLAVDRLQSFKSTIDDLLETIRMTNEHRSGGGS
jgi:hypothetical protein